MKTDDLSLQRSIESAQPSIDHGRDENPATARSSQEPAIELPLTPPTARQSPYAHIKDAQLPDSVISEGIALYFSEFCNQPCPILASSQTLGSSEDDLLPPMILYAMLALSLRSSRHPFLSNRFERMRCIARMTKLSWNLTAKAYCDFAIDDVYFQALCLQVQVDSGDGRLERARAQVASGLRVAQTRDMLSADSLCGLELGDRARRQEIIWSLFMLDRMLLGGNTRNPSTPTTAFELPVIQSGPFHPDIRTQPPEHDISLQCVDSDAPLPPQSVTCLQIQTIRIWECVIDYIAQPPSDTDVPLWRHDSPRAAILTKLLDIEMNKSTNTRKASLLEQLKARIPYRSILNYIEEEYDGAAPPKGANQVHLEEEDLLLLWRLFDYALTSPKSNSECAFDEESNTAMHSVPPLFNASSNVANNQLSINPSPSSSAGMLIQTTSAGLEDIAFQAYGDTSVSGGTAFNYFPDDIDSLHLQ
ncbi:Regulatory protein CAT8 [Alternaria alternata]|nr:Regulatory protein CAT8 [Alternaria alternata]